VLPWPDFRAARPDLAERGEAMFYEFGLGLGFLATVRPDGGPRVHPICPVFHDGALYGLIVPGPKLHDLQRDPRYALHSETCPPPKHDDAFYVTGTVRFVKDAALRQRIDVQFVEERKLEQPWPGFADQILLEFLVDRCLLTLTIADDTFPAGHTVWAAP